MSSRPSVSLIFRNNPVWRIDIDAAANAHWNPYWAHSLGLDPVVRGPHAHERRDNRGHVLNIFPEWDMPCKRPIPKSIRRLSQALPWFATRINLELKPEQRGFDVPPQAELF
jgi:hypothetical protein